MALMRTRKYRMSRRIGQSLFGDDRDPVKTKQYPPGMHGHKGYPRQSDYARQLHEKQKLRVMYNITEKALSRAYKMAIVRGNAISNLIRLLESRLDVVVYRGGLATTIHAAAQLVSHKHVTVNGKVVNIRSYRVVKGDVIAIRVTSKDLLPVLNAVNSDASVPEYLSLNKESRAVDVLGMPSDVASVPYPVTVDFNLVLSYYSA